MEPKADICEQVLVALRRITRAIDLHSRQLIQSHGLTGPQVLLLKKLLTDGGMSVGDLARRVNLSHATVTDILNRLEKRNLVRRVRSELDRRRVRVTATPEADRLLRISPPLLQERFAQRFNTLADWEQTLMLSTLQRIAGMMDAQNLPASPVLTPGPVTSTPEAVRQLEQAADPQEKIDASPSSEHAA